MKPGLVGLILFVVGGLGLLLFSPLFSPDLALVPPGPINLPRFTLLYYLPRALLSSFLLIGAVFIIFTESFSKQDKYWAYGSLGSIVLSWAVWLRD